MKKSTSISSPEEFLKDLKQYSVAIKNNTLKELNFSQPQSMKNFEEWDRHTVKKLVVLNNDLLASGSNKSESKGIITIWNKSGKIVKKLEPKEHTLGVSALLAMPGDLLASGSWGQIQIWHVPTAEMILIFKFETEKEEGGVSALALHPKGYLVAGTSHGKILIYDLKTRKCFKTLYHSYKDHISDLKVLFNENLISVDWSMYTSTIKIWDPEKWENIKTFNSINSLTNALEVLHDGRLVSGSSDGLQIWNVDSGEMLLKFKDKRDDYKDEIDHVIALCVLPSGALAASQEYSDGVKIFEVKTWKCLAHIKVSNFDKNGLAVFPDGSLAIAQDEHISLVQVPTKLKLENILFLLEDLKQNKSVEKLILSNIEIIDKDLDILSDLLKFNQSLKEIDFNHTEVSETGIKKLLPKVKRESVLTILYAGISISLDYYYYHNQAEEKEKAGQYQEALENYEQAMKLKSKEDAFDYEKRAELYEKSGQLEKAIADHLQALRIAPDHTWNSNKLAELYLKLGQHQKAIEIYTQLIEEDSKYADSYYRSRGEIKANQGRIEDALEDYQQAIDSNPGIAKNYIAHGDVYLQLGNFQQALKDYNQAIKVESESYDHYQKRTEVQVELESYQEALKDMTKIINKVKEKESVPYFRLRGDLKRELKQYKEAIQDYDYAIKINDKFTLAYLSRGIIHLLENNKEKASEDILKALKLEPENLEVILGNALLAQYGSAPDLFKAQAYLEQIEAYFKKPENQYQYHLQKKLYFLYGDVAQKLRDTKTANGMFAKVLAIGSYPRATKALEQLKILSETKRLLPIIPTSTPPFPPSREVSREDKLPKKEEAPPKMVDEFGGIKISIAIPYSQLTLGKELGRGGFGIVYEGQYQFGSVAIKTLLHQELKESVIEEFKKEASLMANLRSPFIVSLYGVCLEKLHYSLVMEYMANGSLSNFLQSEKPIEWKIRYQIGIDVGAGLAYLHHHEMVHCDLKSLNILLDVNHRAKLSDFGLSKVKLETSFSTVSGGSTRWMAPELFDEGAKSSKAADVFAYGLVLWELCARKFPFASTRNEAVPILILQGKREKITQDTPPSMAQLIAKCWDGRSESRPKIEEAVKTLQAEQASYKF